MQTVAQMASSIQKISNHAHLRPAAHAWFRRLITGITASGSVVLSEVLRVQVDDRKQLHAAEQGACRALRRDAQFDRIPDAYLAWVAPVAKPMRFRTLDGSDISKPASRKLEHLDVIRDGSSKPRDRVVVGPRGVQSLGPSRSVPLPEQPSDTRVSRCSPCVPTRRAVTRKPGRPRGEPRSAARREKASKRMRYPSAPALKKLGYWTIQIETGDGQGNHLPLFQDIFSTQDPAYQALGPQAWTETYQRAVERVLRHLGPSGVWLADRGFDDVGWMNWMHSRVEQYGIRLKANRFVRPGTKDAKSMQVRSFAASLRTTHRASVRYVDKSTHREMEREVTFGWAPIWVDGVDHAQYVIVVHTGRKNPLLIVTDRRPENEKQAAEIVLAYFERWGNEEMTRVQKQVMALERVRVRSFASIRRVFWLAMLALGIQAYLVATRPKLRQAILARAKDFIRTVRFVLYRVWRVVQADVRCAIERSLTVLLF